MKFELQFEEELREVLNEKFKERLINLKKTGNIFSPMFYLVFTRLVELSSIINDIVLPNEFEIKEMFHTRKEFLQLDYNTINEAVKRIWFFESKREREYDFSKSMEDFLYVIYRMKDIQEKIDRVILKNIREWRKEELAKLYFHLIKVFLEVDEEVNEAVKKLMRIEFIKELLLNLLPAEKRTQDFQDLLDKVLTNNRAIELLLKGGYERREKHKREKPEQKQVLKLTSYFENLGKDERKLVMKAIKSLLIYTE